MHNTDASAAELNSAIFTKAQAAKYLSATTRYIERMVAAGRMRAFKPTRKFWRIRRSELDKFLESGATIENEESRRKSTNRTRHS
jgi:excisionase family DNA binding protein